MILRMCCLIVTEETLSPYALLMPLWKKYFQLEHPLRGVHVLVVDNTADCGLVHSDVIGHIPQHERAEILDASVEKLRLERDDAGRHLYGSFFDAGRPT